MVSNRYKAYNLIFESDIELSELNIYKGEQSPDVVIREGSIPREYHNRKDNIFYYLNVKDVSRYLIQEGNKITIEKYEGAEYEAVKAYLLGWAIGSVLLQRNIMLFHGSAVSKDGNCYMFLGSSGSGKSTLANHMALKGYDIISDEICAVSFDENGQPLIAPVSGSSKLWEDAVFNLGHSTDGLEIVMKSRKKYIFDKHTKTNNDFNMLRSIYILEHLVEDLSNLDEDILDRKLEFKELCGGEKIEFLLKNLYGKKPIKYMKREQEFFLRCSMVARKTTQVIIRKKNKCITADEVSNLVYEDICCKY